LARSRHFAEGVDGDERDSPTVSAWRLGSGRYDQAADQQHLIQLLVPRGWTRSLFAFLLPTLVTGYGVVIPSSPIAGANSLTIGFGTSLLGACIVYVAGIQAVIENPPGT